MIAFKTYNDCAPNLRPTGIPLTAVWQFIEIPDHEEQTYLIAGWMVLSKAGYENYIATHQAEFDLWYANRDFQENNNRLAVLDYVSPEFSHLHPSKIDFRRHLKEGINLDKIVTLKKNGEPEKADYFWQGKLVARIRFSFVRDAFKFMTRRIEWLGYATRGEEINVEYPIYDQIFDPINASHQRERIAEREEARTLIYSTIKARVDAFLAGYFLAQGKTYDEILVIAGNFAKKYGQLVQAFKDTGTPELKNAIQSDTEFEWLDEQMSDTLSEMESATVRQFIVERITY